MIKGIQTLETTRAEGFADKEKNARSSVEAQLAEHSELNQAEYEHGLKEIDADKDAQGTQKGWTCFFAIILGPLIGTAIGSAIGGAAADGAKDKSQEEKKLGGLTDLAEQKKMDDVSKATKGLEDVHADQQDAEKFRRELNESGFIGTT